MKKNYIFLVSIFLLLTIFTSVACKKTEKTYTKDEFSITMNSGFKEKDMTDSPLTYFLESRTSFFTMLKESNEKLVASNIIVNNLDEYLDVVLTKNSLTDTKVDKYQENGKDLRLFSYKQDAGDKKDYYALGVAVKGANAYYLCTFYCLESSKDKFKDDFVTYAKSISIA